MHYQMSVDAIMTALLLPSLLLTMLSSFSYSCRFLAATQPDRKWKKQNGIKEYYKNILFLVEWKWKLSILEFSFEEKLCKAHKSGDRIDKAVYIWMNKPTPCYNNCMHLLSPATAHDHFQSTDDKTKATKKHHCTVYSCFVNLF